MKRINQFTIKEKNIINILRKGDKVSLFNNKVYRHFKGSQINRTLEIPKSFSAAENLIDFGAVELKKGYIYLAESETLSSN